ncbi:MAG: YaeQ family protein [Moraxellaceae bacterium]|nr:YaeQ family protein [Pseudomonadales bacterium]MCP5174516.1 YaeQ family protein [Moraxellaceae bacterium]MCP5177205.1 YaeQ family protein [Moraxellaceae bacterium]HQV22106.1 YaeQ family protein [Agitococcus sp.]
MALKSTIFKAELSITDMDRDYYATHQLTIAQHPSETDERMMVRIVAFALYANENLQFTKGLSAEDEPDLWQKNLRDEIDVWIDLGQPDEKRIRKACSRGQQAIIVSYGGGSDIWWKKTQDKLSRFDNLTVINLATPEVEALGQAVERTMQIQCTIQQGQLWLSIGEQSIEVNPIYWRKAH